MKTHGFFETKPYVVMTDSKGYYYIDNICTYGDLMGMVAEEITSPRGVESKLQVGGSDGDYFLFYWQPGGKRMILEHFSRIEDAELEWLNRIYEFDFLNHELSCVTFDKIDDAIEYIANSLEVSVETTKSLLKWHKKLQEIFAKQEKNRRVSFLKQALRDADWKATRKLKQAVIRFKNVTAMWGTDYRIMVKMHYSEDELKMYRQAKEILQSSCKVEE